MDKILGLQGARKAGIFIDHEVGVELSQLKEGKSIKKRGKYYFIFHITV